ncbi:hypothetical protein MANAM107_22040 [Actinomyces capricornis]|uniref:Uncharacterized protein n=1 Tax=Actinomyces capricornis TaxID=2755559 RepID=A0ABN6KB45_9ACTO|nr:hypothetical protein MANAM107_22040 [Actinomyces capricornis]
MPGYSPAGGAGRGGAIMHGAADSCGEPAAQRVSRGAGQLKDSPQAQVPAALGLSMVKPCFSMVSAKSMVAPER